MPTTTHVDAESNEGAASVIVDPDGSGFHIQLPGASIEINATQLSAIVTAGQAILQPPAPPPKIAFMGDSNFLIRSGVTVSQTLPNLLAAALSTSEFSVFAVGGHNSANGLALLPSVLAYAPGETFIDYGVNDAQNGTTITPAAYEANLRTILDALLLAGSNITLLSPMVVAETGYIERQRDFYMPAWRRVARDYRAQIRSVDVWTAVSAVAFHTSRAAFDALQGDVQHWNAAGNIWRRDLILNQRGA